MFTIAKTEAARGIWSAFKETLSEPARGMVMVDVIAAGICGTDYHIYSWDAWSAGRIKTPMTIGHEFVGRISAIGEGVTGYSIGDRVSAECHIACGECHFCRTGNAHICEKTSIIGVDRPGAFAEQVEVPASNLWRVPDAIPDKHAAVFDPVGNAMHMVATAKVTAKNVLIVGGGPIGLFAAAIAKAHGARTVALQEPNKALNASLDIAAPGAVVALLGIPAGLVELDLGAKVVMKGVSLIGITGRRMYETWYQVEAFMLKNPDLMDKVITHVLPATDFAHGFELMDEGACGKIVLDFQTLDQRLPI